VAIIPKKNFAIIGAVTLVAALGAAGVATASGGSGAAGSGSENGETEQRVVGSVKAPAESATEQDDATESAALQAVATVTEEQAKAAAAAAASGTASSVEISEEDGYVVYSVEVKTSAGITDVTVDAGNGKVLLQENEGPEDLGDDSGSRDGEHED
jgi:hypothetical protein